MYGHKHVQFYSVITNITLIVIIWSVNNKQEAAFQGHSLHPVLHVCVFIFPINLCRPLREDSPLTGHETSQEEENHNKEKHPQSVFQRVFWLRSSLWADSGSPLKQRRISNVLSVFPFSRHSFSFRPVDYFFFPSFSESVPFIFHGLKIFYLAVVFFLYIFIEKLHITWFLFLVCSKSCSHLTLIS